MIDNHSLLPNLSWEGVDPVGHDHTANFFLFYSLFLGLLLGDCLGCDYARCAFPRLRLAAYFSSAPFTSLLISLELLIPMV
jgi:hypothetical protein